MLVAPSRHLGMARRTGPADEITCHGRVSHVCKIHAPLDIYQNLYRSLIRSKLDYGCIVYGSARGFYLRMLDPIQNHALRLCLGAYRTSSASSLCVEANEPPLYCFSAIKKLHTHSLQVICKLLVSKRVMLLHLLYQPHHLGF